MCLGNPPPGLPKSGSRADYHTEARRGKRASGASCGFQDSDAEKHGPATPSKFFLRRPALFLRNSQQRFHWFHSTSGNVAIHLLIFPDRHVRLRSPAPRFVWLRACSLTCCVRTKLVACTESSLAGMTSPSTTVVLAGPPTADPNALPSVGGALGRPPKKRAKEYRTARFWQEAFVLRSANINHSNV